MSCHLSSQLWAFSFLMTPTPATPSTWENLVCSVSNWLRKACLVPQPYLTRNSSCRRRGFLCVTELNCFDQQAFKCPSPVASCCTRKVKGPIWNSLLQLCRSDLYYDKSLSALTEAGVFWIRRGKIQDGCHKMGICLLCLLYFLVYENRSLQFVFQNYFCRVHDFFFLKI